jgi:hypothetical protein
MKTRQIEICTAIFLSSSSGKLMLLNPWWNACNLAVPL